MNMKNLTVFIKLKDSESTLAIVKVIFTTTEFGPIVIKGFRVVKGSSDKIWVDPPKVHAYGKYYITTFLEEKVIWHKVSGAILEDYYKAASRLSSGSHSSEVGVGNEEISPDEIPDFTDTNG